MLISPKSPRKRDIISSPRDFRRGIHMHYDMNTGEFVNHIPDDLPKILQLSDSIEKKKETAKVYGMITEHETGLPAAGAILVFTPVGLTGKPYTAKCANDGSYSIEDVIVGTYNVSCTLPDRVDIQLSAIVQVPVGLFKLTGALSTAIQNPPYSPLNYSAPAVCVTTPVSGAAGSNGQPVTENKTYRTISEDNYNHSEKKNSVSFKDENPTTSYGDPLVIPQSNGKEESRTHAVPAAVVVRNVDPRGVTRGHCLECGEEECSQYMAQENFCTAACDYCGHPPTRHLKIKTSP